MRGSIAGLFVVVVITGCGGATLKTGNPSSEDGGANDLSALMEPPDIGVVIPCGESNCAAGQVCELGSCHIDCGQDLGSAARCGVQPNEVCCQAGNVCYLGACVVPGIACGAAGADAGACAVNNCPDGQYCEPSIGHCLMLAQTGLCEYHPPPGSFSPKVKWEWMGSTTLPLYNQVMMAPMVGDVDGDCMPDVVFTTFTGGNYATDGVIRAMRGDGSAELFNVTDAALRAIPGAQLAIADVDGDGKLEIFGCNESGAAMSLTSTGAKRWISTVKPCAWDAPVIADVDHDGKPEIIIGFTVLDSMTGAVKGTPPAVPRPTIGGNPYGYYSTVAEMDGNVTNGMEIVGGGVVYHWDGTLYWNKSAGSTGYSAVADIDGDGLPDVVSVVPGTNSVNVYQHDGTLIWGPVDVNNGVPTPKGPSGGGPPTVADFDGDGLPDIATAGGYGYLVIKGQTGKVLWQSTATTDTSSRVTGSSVFNFLGDGPAQAIYNDEHNLRVYNGPDGTVLVKLCSTSGTLWEYPVIVDVDADDHAEIVVMDNNYTINTCDQDTGGGPSHTGFRVIGDQQNRWVRTRRIWNEHAYHVTNVNDDGTVPQSEADNWSQAGLNNFRQNVQTHNLFNAPDLVPRDLHAITDKCDGGTLTLVATVLNQGAASAPAGLPVSFYRADGMGGTILIGTVTTKAVMLAGAGETVSIDFLLPAPDGGTVDAGPFSITVIVNNAGTPMSGVVNECDETNNTSAPATLGCPQIG